MYVYSVLMAVGSIRYMLHGTHGSATSMDGILIYGNRYLFMVVFHPSHGQITTNRMVLRPLALTIIPPFPSRAPVR